MFPKRSFLTGVNAAEPRRSEHQKKHHSLALLVILKQAFTVNSLPNRVVRDSAAWRNSAVEIPLSLAASMGTSVKDFWMVSNQVEDMVALNETRLASNNKQMKRNARG